MPVQKFAPMTKNFAIFDCDAHVTEPPWLWERAKDWLTQRRIRRAQGHDLVRPRKRAANRQRQGRHRPRLAANPWRHPGTMQRALAGRPRPQARYPARPQRAQSQPQNRADRRSRPTISIIRDPTSPSRACRDMDIQGIDQVMIIPTDIDTYPWLQNALGAQGDVQGLQRLGL